MKLFILICVVISTAIIPHISLANEETQQNSPNEPNQPPTPTRELKKEKSRLKKILKKSSLEASQAKKFERAAVLEIKPDRHTETLGKKIRVQRIQKSAAIQEKIVQIQSQIVDQSPNKINKTIETQQLKKDYKKLVFLKIKSNTEAAELRNRVVPADANMSRESFYQSLQKP